MITKKLGLYSAWDEEFAYRSVYGDLFFCVDHYVKYYEKKPDGGIKIIRADGCSMEIRPKNKDQLI